MHKLRLALRAPFSQCLARELFGAFDISQRCEHLSDRDTTARDQLRRTKFAVGRDTIFHRAQCLGLIAGSKVRPADAFQCKR